MPLIRGQHAFDDHFTQIPNAWLRDNRLSFKARGLLALLVSHSAGWRLSIARLESENIEGRDAIRSAIAELEQLGYLERSQQNDGGRFGEAVWTTKDPDPSSGFPSSGFPTSDNPQLKNTSNKKTTNKNNIKNTNVSAWFEEFWKTYPRKRDKGAAFKAFRSAMSRATFEDVIAGAIRYANDPTRDPQFTKYPATWLNADGWEDDYQSADDTAKRSAERRQRELERTQEFLAEQKQQAEQAAPPPKCEHGKTKALCAQCLR